MSDSTNPERPQAPVLDHFGRMLRNLRLSVTDRCNLRCHYCMPDKDYPWLPKSDRLTFEELARLVKIMLPIGVQRVRLTGGEPLLRRELPRLVAQLNALRSPPSKGGRIPGLTDLSLTTNGILLDQNAVDLRAAGLDRLTVSLDTLQPARFARDTGQDRLADVLRGLEAAREAGFSSIKINTVLSSGSNADELESMLAFALEGGYELRFIEYMDVGGALDWSADKVVSKAVMLERIKARFGEPEPVETEASAPARRFQLPGGGRFGIIASTTQPFCSACTRSRLTADGVLYTCLYGSEGRNVRQWLRSDQSDLQIEQRLTDIWRARADRGAEERLAEQGRGTSVNKQSLRDDPHLEMHTKGG